MTSDIWALVMNNWKSQIEFEQVSIWCENSIDLKYLIQPAKLSDVQEEIYNQSKSYLTLWQVRIIKVAHRKLKYSDFGKLTWLRSIVFDKKSPCLRTKVRLLLPTFLWDHQVGTFLYHKETSLSSASCSWGVKSSLLTPKSSRIEVSTASLNSGEQTKITFLAFNRSKSINLVGELFDFNRS